MRIKRQQDRRRDAGAKTQAARKVRHGAAGRVAEHGYSTEELALFERLVRAKRDEALLTLRECQESMRSIESQRDLYAAREPSADYDERALDASMLQELRLMIARQATLAQYLEGALTSLRNGTYGVCVSCNARIPRGRLEAVPHARRCVQCEGG